MCFKVKEDTMLRKQAARCASVAAILVASASFGEDAYIESDGTREIQTGYCVTTNSRIEMDFQLPDIENQYRIFSSGPGNNGSNTTNLQCDCYVGSGAGKFLFSIYYTKADGTQKGHNVVEADTLRHTIVMDYTAATKHFQVWTDGTMSGYYNCEAPFLNNGRSTVPIALCGKNYNEYALSAGRLAKVKIYRFKAYEGGELVMDLEPCVKGGVAGLRDNCRPGRFVQSEDVKAYTAGGDIDEVKDDPYLYSPRNDFYVRPGLSIFLDTGYSVRPTTRVELDYAMLTPDWSKDNLYHLSPYIIGCNDGTRRMYLYVPGSSDDAYGYYKWRIGTDSEKNITPLTANTAYNVRRTVAMDSNSIHVVTAGYTNYVATVASGKELASEITNCTLKIGASFTGASRFLPMKIYGLKLYESNELVKDYRPFITNSVAGFVNALDETDKLYSFTYKGTRTDGGVKATNVVFSAGGNISDRAEEQEAYLEFDGVNGHRIDTGYVITKDSCIDIDFALWSTTYNGQQMFFEQRGYKSNAADCNGIWARLYINSGYVYSFILQDYKAAYTPTGVNVSNERKQFKLDVQNGKVTVMCGEKLLKEMSVSGTRTATTCSSTLKIGSTWNGSGPSGGTGGTCMQLYSFKISESGVLTRHYVPCVNEGKAGLYDLCQGQFFALTGGKVYGRGYKGQSERGTFEISPKPAKLEAEGDTNTLTCLAPGASSFEWYENGKLIEGATTDSYTVEWQARAPHVRTYSVVPVYTVFNEKVRGEAAAADVEFSPLGMVLFLK